MTLYPIIRSLLFQLDAETAHNITLKMMRLGLHGPIASSLRARVPDQPCEVMGLVFPNRIGLAAGLDKNAEYIDALGALGFGHIEVGTLTPVPQDGNPSPRLFRLSKHEAIINRMGFNNRGIDVALEQLKHRRFRGIVGVNIGKNKVTPNDQAVNDYLVCLRKAYSHADYITVNISSPNTPGLRQLQGAEALKRLLESLQIERDKLATSHQRRVPLVLKIAPDLDQSAMDDIASCVLACQLDGLIVGNTTLSRPGVESYAASKEAGGLSGKPLMSLSTRVLREMNMRLEDKTALIGCGGITNGDDAIEKMKAGAGLVQLYTGLIYRGPDLIQEIAKALIQYQC